MNEQQTTQQQSNRFRYVVVSVFVVVLFGLGILAGNSLNANVASSSEDDSGNEQKPGGAAIVEPPHAVQDFTLIDQNGEPMSLSNLRGQAVLMFFGYINCPDVCPTTLSDYTLVKDTLGREADDVTFVFISVDGERDTPELMADFLSYFDSEFIGLTGDEDVLRQIGAEYGLMFEPDGTENYAVQHTSPSFLIDPDGYLRMVFFYGTDTDDIANGISEILES